MPSSPTSFFQSEHYLLHNQKRLEHLASLNLDLNHKTVLEVGAGIGDHTQFYLNRRCTVTSVEARAENLEVLTRRFPQVKTYCLDFDSNFISFEQKFDIVHCYGFLYHLQNPDRAISVLSDHCQGLLLIETCVSYGDKSAVNLCEEPTSDPTQSFTGIGCRPTRKWVFNELKKHFEFVYLPITQPDHAEFPTNWQERNQSTNLSRAVFIGARSPIKNPLFVDYVLDRQKVLSKALLS